MCQHDDEDNGNHNTEDNVFGDYDYNDNVYVPPFKYHFNEPDVMRRG